MASDTFYNDFFGDAGDAPAQTWNGGPLSPEQEAAVNAAFDAQCRTNAARAAYHEAEFGGDTAAMAAAATEFEAARAEYLRLADLAPPQTYVVRGESTMRPRTAHEEAWYAAESARAAAESRARAEYDMEAEGRD